MWPCAPVPSTARVAGAPRDSPATDCRFRWGTPLRPGPSGLYVHSIRTPDACQPPFVGHRLLASGHWLLAVGSRLPTHDSLPVDLHRVGHRGARRSGVHRRESRDQRLPSSDIPMRNIRQTPDAVARQRARHAQEGLALRALSLPAHKPAGAWRVVRPDGSGLLPAPTHAGAGTSMVPWPSRARAPRIAVCPPSANGSRWPPSDAKRQLRHPSMPATRSTNGMHDPPPKISRPPGCDSCHSHRLQDCWSREYLPTRVNLVIVRETLRLCCLPRL